MSGWGTNYLGTSQPKKPLSALSSHERSRHEYYSHPQDMASYRDRYEEAGVRGRGHTGGNDGGGVAQLWVFRVVHLTDVTLGSFIRRQGIEVLDVQEVSHREAAYKSFMVTVYERDAPTLLQRTFWPGLVSCKYWHEQIDVNRGGALSRRSSAKGNRGAHHDKYVSQGPPPEKTEYRPKNVSGPRRSNHNDQNHGQKNRSTQKIRKSASSSRVISSKGKSNHDARRKDDIVKNRNLNNGNNKIDRKSRQGSGKREKRKDNGKNYDSNDSKGNKDKSKAKKYFDDKFNSWKNGTDKDRSHGGPKGSDRRYGPDDNDKIRSNSNKGKENDKHNRRMQVEDRLDRRKSSRVRPIPTTDIHHEDKLPEHDVSGRRQIGDKSRNTRHSSTVKSNTKQVNNKESDKRQIGEKNRGSRHLGKDHSYSTGNGKDSSRGGGHLLPEIPRKNHHPPASRSGSLERSKPVSARYTSTLPSIHGSRHQKHAGTPASSSKEYPNWVLSLSGLLILSSEEVVHALLGPKFDGLLGQDIITDDELFLGVKVLAHASRAKMSEEILQHLVLKIWQPHIIHLIKTFTVTVERLYPERAERYFWDLAEFLDMYVSRKIHIDQMPSLINTCLMEVLALSYKSFLSDDIVKVFRVMQSRVGKEGNY